MKEILFSVLFLAAIIMLAILFAKIPELDDFPEWLIREKILDKNAKTDFELAKLLFGAQVTLTAVFVTFLGLLVQFFEKKDKFLGIDFRQVIFSNSFIGMRIYTIASTAFGSSLISYYFLARNELNQVLFIFVINLILLIYLLSVYSNIVTGKVAVEDQVLTIVENQIIHSIQEENKEFSA